VARRVATALIKLNVATIASAFTRRGRSSGVEVDYDYWAVFTFRDGKIVRTEWFEGRDAALEAAGLSE
jgi:ketosteroid isomerase-like protein